MRKSAQPPRRKPARAKPRYTPQRPARIVRRPVPVTPAPSSARRHGRMLAIGLAGLLLLLATTLVAFRIAAAWRETASVAGLAPPAGMHVATSKGRLFVQDAGPRDAVPIVLIHGTAAWSEFWRGTIDHLVAQGHRVIAVDLPPFGFSDRSPEGAYTRADQAARLNEALAALKIDKAVLVGHSFGAGATVETVLRHPQRIRGLVLVAPALALPQEGAPPPPAGGPSLPQRVLGLPLAGEAIVSATITNPLLTRFGLSMMLARKEAATDALADVIRQPMRLPGTTRDIAAWLQYFLTADAGAYSMSPERYRSIGAPTRLIWGDMDTLTPLAQGERLSTLVPGARLEVLRGLGHIPQIEDPTSFRAALAKALREIAAAP